MSFSRRKKFDPRTASFGEAKAYFASRYGPYIADAKDQKSLNEMINGVQAVGGKSPFRSPRYEALVYLASHGVPEQDLKQSSGEIRVSMQMASGTLPLSPWARFRFWLLDTFARGRR